MDVIIPVDHTYGNPVYWSNGYSGINPSHNSSLLVSVFIIIITIIIVLESPRDGIPFRHNYRKLYNQSNLWEGLFTDVFNEHINKKITTGNICRPPKVNNSNTAIEDFMLELNPIIDKLLNENSYAIFTGNFNINLLEANPLCRWCKFDEFSLLF